MTGQFVDKSLLGDISNFNEIDIHFADFIVGLEDKNSHQLLIAAALVSAEIRAGNVCLDLKAVAGRKLESMSQNEQIILPELEAWVNYLRDCEVVGAPGDFKPLILDDNNRLYFYRYWEYEQKLAKLIRIRTIDSIPLRDSDVFRQSLSKLFPAANSGPFDFQKLAAFIASVKRFCVITGGPGTGKTSTVIKILALLLEQNSDLKIALTAPTGKAAARLQESITDSLPTLEYEEYLKSLIPVQASTIHRLLGTKPYSPYFKYDKANRMPYDVVVIDEASMVDLPLMSKLVQAMKDVGRLIIIGDKDQLASVDSGAILGDICSHMYEYDYSQSLKRDYKAITGQTMPFENEVDKATPIRDSIVELKRNYRFAKSGGIGTLSELINNGRSDEAMQALRAGSYSNIEWLDLPPPEKISNSIEELVLEYYGGFVNADDPRTALELFSRFKILGAVNDGPYGIKNLNHLVERILYESRLINPRHTWYKGRPIIITKNDYRLDLYNGDIGIVFPDEENRAELRSYFIGVNNSLRAFSPIRLPALETVYAMTVHKSQGSEFDEILLILPDRDNPVMTRELLYTGITRARKKIRIWATDQIFKAAIGRRLKRVSGLAEMLWD